jgi:hypothetical protein
MWAKLNEKFGTNRPWHTLNPMEQQAVMQAINTILTIIHHGQSS